MVNQWNSNEFCAYQAQKRFRSPGRLREGGTKLSRSGSGMGWRLRGAAGFVVAGGAHGYGAAAGFQGHGSRVGKAFALERLR